MLVKAGVPAAPSPVVPPSQSKSSFASTLLDSRVTKFTPAEYAR